MNITELPCGYRLFHHRTQTPITNIRFVVDAGAYLEDESNFGAAHYLEHMFFKGTKSKTWDRVNRITSRLGNVNAYTGHERTVFHITTLSETWKEAAGILCEMFFEPAMPEDEFDKERSVILEELKTSQDDPQTHFLNKAIKLFLGREKVLGTEQSLKSMGVQDLLEFRKQWYTPKSCLISVIGDVLEADAIQFMSRWAEKNYELPSRDRNVVLEQQGTGDKSFTHPSKQAIIALVWRGNSCNESLQSNFADNVMCCGVGGGMHSLMFSRLREELGLCYSTHMFTWGDPPMTMALTLLDESNIDKAREEVDGILATVRESGLDDELLEISRRKLMFQMAQRTETSAALGAMLADQFFDFKERIVPFEQRRSALNCVTNEHVIEAARQLKDPLFLVQRHG